MIWENVVPYKQYRLAICLSGGMDSCIAYYFAQKELGFKPDDIFLFWVDMGQPYAQQEEKAIDSFDFSKKVVKFHFDLMRKELGNLPTPDKQIIPSRNLYLAWVGGFFANEVWISALDGEMHDQMPDKNWTFFKLATDILTYTYDKPTIITTPFPSLSKTEIAQWMVRNYGSGFANNVIARTRTCYSESNDHCGKCSTCFKRWVALVNAGLECQNDFETYPPMTEEAKKLIEKYKIAIKTDDFSHYSTKRIRETHEALARRGIEWS